ncbi:MAG: glycosyl hydrolase family 8 [Candidatus Nanopelagicales bacterium]
MRRTIGSIATAAAVALLGVPAASPALAATATHPFPAHATYTAGVIKPTNVTQAAMDSKVQSLYTTWKSTYLRSDGGQGTWVKYDSTSSTVSEAHGYGMVLAAYFADQATFDSMYGYYRKHLSSVGPNLMAWKQTLKNGVMKNVEGSDSATDGDLDIAYALQLADTQWGSAGPVNYRTAALAMLRNILTYDVNQTTWTLNPGDWAHGSAADNNHTRPSDFMTDHLVAFAKLDPANATKWNNVSSKIAGIVNAQAAAGSSTTGLVPDFMVLSGGSFVPVSGTYLESNHDGDFDYNACRTPWRLAMSYIANGRTDLLASQLKTNTWIRGATGGTPTKVRAGYYVKNGTNGKAYVSYDDLAFTAPMAVNAMLGGSSGQTWLNNLWTSITGGNYGSKTDYYGDTIRLQVLLVVSGNWWAP